MAPFDDLPPPAADELNRSHALALHIQTLIDANGPLSFSTFMEKALYHQTLGYYNAESFNIGKHGDFTTAPEISPLFARCFATPCSQLFDHLGSGDILELGAGTGRFAGDLLLELAKRDALPAHYYIYDISAACRKKQHAFLQTACPHLLPRVRWIEEWPSSFTGMIIANEVLDAMPVDCFHLTDRSVLTRYVTGKQGIFHWQLGPPLDHALTETVMSIREDCSLPAGYESEVNLSLPDFMRRLAQSLTKGAVLFADYGYGRKEYYHPERQHGTLTCFYQHRRHHHPFYFPGLQDITAHVDFTRVIEAAALNDCQLQGYTSQAAFLLSNGLMQLASDLSEPLAPHESFALHHAIKLLTMPTEMGERIKIMALSKNIELNLKGFDFQDARRFL